jgi:prepilin-type N-terminal cleavage/methylation domain-containing protein
MANKQKGFSLIELLIVTTIILVIAAVAIPNLLRSRMSANEASAVASTRTVITAEIIYSSTYVVGFSANLASLSDGGAPANCLAPAAPAATSACLIDPTLASGTKSGYVFTYGAAGGAGINTTFTLHADPISGVTGLRHYFTDASDVVHVNFTAPASVTDPAL